MNIYLYFCKKCNSNSLSNYNKIFAFQTLKECYERVCETRKFNGTEYRTEPTRRSNGTNFKIKLLCRDDTSLVIEIVDNDDTFDDDGTYGNHSRHSKYSSRKQKANGNLYMVKIERGNVLSEKIYYIVSIHNSHP